MQIYLIRHGQDLNPDPDRLSNTDPAIGDAGEKQAVACALKIQKELGAGVLPRIITSPRKRTTQTAKVIADQLGVDPAAIQSDDRLRERDSATYAGQLVKEVFSEPESKLIAGGMESYSSLRDRLSAFYDGLLKVSDTPVIVVSHSGNVKPLVELARNNRVFSGSDQDLMSAEDFVRLS